MPVGLDKLWLVVTALAGLVFLYAMERVYLIDTVPTWYSVFTPLGFVLTVLIGGPLLGYLLLRAAGVPDAAMRYLPWVSSLALLATCWWSFCRPASYPQSTVPCSRR